MFFIYFITALPSTLNIQKPYPSLPFHHNQAYFSLPTKAIQSSCNSVFPFPHIIISHRMELKPKTATQFFPIVNQAQFLPIDPTTLHLSSFFILKHSLQKQNKIVLKDNLLLLACAEEQGLDYTHVLMLTEDIKFQRIFEENRGLSQPRVLKGFRLINSKKEFTDIVMPFEDLVKIWVRELGKIINEVGFQHIYQMVKKIGKGSTASVFQIRRIEDQEIFAAKVVLKSYLAQKEERWGSLNHEIALLRAMDHDNIIRLYGVFESDHAVYLIFQRLSGGNLVERINQQRGFTLSQVKQIMKGIVQGLAYLHKFDIAHRDIKLQNIIFKDQATLQPVIADFGLAVFTQEEPYAYYRCGTPGYVAPEIIRMKENKKAKVACDIFSAGVIFHVLLTNSYLFEGKTSDEVYKSNYQARLNFGGEKYAKVDGDAVVLLEKMLSVKVGERITADEILDEDFLQEIREKEEISPAVTEVGDYIL